MKNVFILFVICAMGLQLTGCQLRGLGTEFVANNEQSPPDVHE